MRGLRRIRRLLRPLAHHLRPSVITNPNVYTLKPCIVSPQPQNPRPYTLNIEILVLTVPAAFRTLVLHLDNPSSTTIPKPENPVS